MNVIRARGLVLSCAFGMSVFGSTASVASSSKETCGTEATLDLKTLEWSIDCEFPCSWGCGQYVIELGPSTAGIACGCAVLHNRRCCNLVLVFGPGEAPVPRPMGYCGGSSCASGACTLLGSGGGTVLTAQCQ